MLESEVERRRDNSSSCLSYESKEALAAHWPAADWLLLYSSILITARQKKNLENPPIKWKLEFQLCRKGHASWPERCSNLVQFVPVSIGAHIILKVTWFTVCSHVSIYVSSHQSQMSYNQYYPQGRREKKDKVKKMTSLIFSDVVIESKFALFSMYRKHT